MGIFNPKNGLSYEVSTIIKHSGYNPLTLEHDIAIVTFSPSIPNTKTLKVSTAVDPNPGEMIKVSGYGTRPVS